MTLDDLDLPAVTFRSSDEADAALRAACDANPDLAACETIGHSEEGRPLLGVTLGTGPAVATLVAGAHADEPVGPEALRRLVTEGLGARGWGAPDGGLADLFDRVTLRVVPHANPDAEARNRPWARAWDAGDPAASLGAFLRHRRREPPGRDVEFGYPAMRPENRAVRDFLFAQGAPAVHASLHGMAFSEGALVLVERRWIGRPAGAALAAGWLAAAAAAGLRPHDHDRGGDKGFVYGGPGLWSTPEGAAMRAHFLDAGDAATAAGFHRSSMEEAIAAAPRGAPPLCVVPEVPLFVVGTGRAPTPARAAHLAAFLDELPAMEAAAHASAADGAADGGALAPFVDRHAVTCVRPADAVRLHLRLLQLALDAVGA